MSTTEPKKPTLLRRLMDALAGAPEPADMKGLAKDLARALPAVEREILDEEAVERRRAAVAALAAARREEREALAAASAALTAAEAHVEEARAEVERRFPAVMEARQREAEVRHSFGYRRSQAEEDLRRLPCPILDAAEKDLQERIEGAARLVVRRVFRTLDFSQRDSIHGHRTYSNAPAVARYREALSHALREVRALRGEPLDVSVLEVKVASLLRVPLPSQDVDLDGWARRAVELDEEEAARFEASRPLEPWERKAMRTAGA